MSYRHGTYYAYAKKRCRCDACASRQRERVARNRADRLASGRLNHGTRSAFDAGCRCPECAEARQVAAVRLNERDRARERAERKRGAA